MIVTFYRGESSQPVVLWCPACPFFTPPAGGGEAGLVLVIIFTAPFLCLPLATIPWWDTPFPSPWPQRVPSGHRPGQQWACLSSCTGKSPCLCFLSHICLNHIEVPVFPEQGPPLGENTCPALDSVNTINCSATSEAMGTSVSSLTDCALAGWRPVEKAPGFLSLLLPSCTLTFSLLAQIHMLWGAESQVYIKVWKVPFTKDFQEVYRLLGCRAAAYTGARFSWIPYS